MKEVEMRYREQFNVPTDYTVRALGGCVLDTGLGKSSRSADSANCVAAGALEDPAGNVTDVLLGDSKTGQVLPSVSAEAFIGFIAAVRQGDFDI